MRHVAHVHLTPRGLCFNAASTQRTSHLNGSVDANPNSLCSPADTDPSTAGASATALPGQ